VEKRYVIIGNGIAGLSAAKEIRKQDVNGSIKIISEESYPTYFRTKLTELVGIDFDHKSLLVNKEEWYRENKIELILDSFVDNIDIANKFIKTEKLHIDYDKLLISTGSKPFIPHFKGTDKRGIFAIRTLDDIYKLNNYLMKCTKVSVVGGGLLGIEACWALKKAGKEVTVINKGKYLLNKQVDYEIGFKLEERLISEGIGFILDKDIEEIIGVDEIKGLKFTDGNILDTDCVLISTGIQPRIDIIRDTAIKYNRGIIVDENLRTNVDDIYAAGDVIEINDQIIGLWTSSNEQGKIAGTNMAGGKLLYTVPRLFCSLKLDKIQVFSAGEFNEYDRIYEYKNDDGDIHHKIFVREGIIIGVILFGDLQELNSLRNAVINMGRIEDYLVKGLPFQ